MKENKWSLDRLYDNQKLSIFSFGCVTNFAIFSVEGIFVEFKKKIHCRKWKTKIWSLKRRGLMDWRLAFLVVDFACDLSPVVWTVETWIFGLLWVEPLTHFCFLAEARSDFFVFLSSSSSLSLSCFRRRDFRFWTVFFFASSSELFKLSSLSSSSSDSDVASQFSSSMVSSASSSSLVWSESS
jgi:hypothetical protein